MHLISVAASTTAGTPLSNTTELNCGSVNYIHVPLCMDSQYIYMCVYYDHYYVLPPSQSVCVSVWPVYFILLPSWYPLFIPQKPSALPLTTNLQHFVTNLLAHSVHCTLQRHFYGSFPYSYLCYPGLPVLAAVARKMFAYLSHITPSTYNMGSDLNSGQQYSESVSSVDH